MVPAQVLKSVSLSSDALCCELNVTGVVMGFGYKNYKWEWWCMPLQCRLTSLGLGELCDHHKVKQWALKGASLADSLGREGGDTHTQELSQLYAIC